MYRKAVSCNQSQYFKERKQITTKKVIYYLILCCNQSQYFKERKQITTMSAGCVSATGL